jgi:glycosyltransferase involved in cell wall biosynthesis
MPQPTELRPPQVSVIIPAHNRARLLQDAVESCRASAPGVHIEIIVVDDASQEDLAAATSGSGVVFERLAVNSGSSVARNRGVALARGRYLKFLDSDDVLLENSLAQEYDVAVASRADILVTGWIESRLDDAGAETVRSTCNAPRFGSIIDDLLAGKAVPTSSALYRAPIAAATQWDAALSKLNDWDYFVRAAVQSAKIVTLDQPAYRWREHTGARITTSATFLSHAKEFFCILEKLEAILLARGEYTVPRQRRMAQYLYKELRGAYRFDPPLGQTILAKILALDPAFTPRDEERSQILRLAFRVLPPDWALTAYGAGRRAADRVSRAFH